MFVAVGPLCGVWGVIVDNWTFVPFNTPGPVPTLFKTPGACRVRGRAMGFAEVRAVKFPDLFKGAYGSTTYVRALEVTPP